MIRTLLAVLIVIHLFSGQSSVQAEETPPLTEAQLAHESVKIAAVQMQGNWIWQGNDDAPQETVDEVVAYIERAAADGCDLVAFPELLLGKFTVPNESTRRISEAAAAGNIYVLAGCFEILDDEGNYGNSILVFGRDGEIIGRAFKAHAAGGAPPYLFPLRPDDAEFLWTPATEFPIFDLDFGRIGIMICYDGLFPEVPRILSLKGAEIIFWVNAHHGVIEDYVTRTVSQLNHVHVVGVNKSFGAGTNISAWPGKPLAVIPEREDDYISAALPFGQLREVRKHAREFFQRRPDIYGALVQEHPVWRYYENLPENPEHTGHWADVEPVIVEEVRRGDPSMRLGEDLSSLAVRMRARWMEGWITLRLPEVLQSSLGCHFNDSWIPDVQMMSPIDPWPEWQYDEKIKEWRYEHTTPQGIYFSAAARPWQHTVYLEVTVKNNTDGGLSFVDFNPCFNMNEAPEFNQRGELAPLHTWIDGEFRSLTTTTPTPEEKDRAPWITMRVKNAVYPWDGPSDSDTWWLLDQVADYNLLVAISRDEKYLVGYAWDTAPSVLMSNCGHPCFHAGPAPATRLEPGDAFTRRGRVYFMKNEPEELLKEYLMDKHNWDRWPLRPVGE